MNTAHLSSLLKQFSKTGDYLYITVAGGLYDRYAELIDRFYKDLGCGAKPQDGHNLHDALHSKRVLFLALLIGLLIGMDDVLLEQVGLAAAAHDIGRTHQGVDDEHGAKSAVRLGTLVDHLSEEVQNVISGTVLFAITNHSIDDDAVDYNQIPGGPLKVAEAATVLAVLKDADALDRVRLGDLDERFLRTKEAHSLIWAAKELLGLK